MPVKKVFFSIIFRKLSSKSQKKDGQGKAFVSKNNKISNFSFSFI